MKIERSYGEYSSDLYQQKRSVDSPATQESQKSASNPSVKLSETAKKIRSNQEANQVNVDKVAAIKKAIQEGTYQVSPKEIADSMWQHMKDQ